MAIYHQGTDAGHFDYVEVVTSDRSSYSCDFFDAGLIDDNQFATSKDCFES